MAVDSLARLRWKLELDYRQLKSELGLDHYEGHSWLGWHHHTALVTAAHGFLTLERLCPRARRPALTLPKAVVLLQPVFKCWDGRCHTCNQTVDLDQLLLEATRQDQLPGPTRVAYEAGPTGFGLARELTAMGVGCVVAAPGKIPRAPQDRVKTDRRDAEKLARLLMAGELHPVRVPATDEEALRDLVRAREDLRGDLMRARHRVGKLLLRHDVRYAGNNWTVAHRNWLASIALGEPVAQAVLEDGLGSIDALLVRRESLERQMTALVPGSPWAQEVARLRCLRGIDTLSALGLCAEIGDFDRFRRPGQLMSYLGMVPSEHSTGDKRRLGSITKSGSQHARRLLVEAAWHYRRPPRIGRELARRQDGQPQHVTAISWQAQRRLHRTWQRLDGQRGKRRTIVAVAVGRELAGFCWAVTTAG